MWTYEQEVYETARDVVDFIFTGLVPEDWEVERYLEDTYTDSELIDALRLGRTWGELREEYYDTEYDAAFDRVTEGEDFAWSSDMVFIWFEPYSEEGEE